MRRLTVLFTTLMFTIGLAQLPTRIAHAAGASGLSIELNKLETAGQNCLMSFVVSNNTGTNFDNLAYEVVLFDDQQRIARMTVFDFKNIATGKTRVRQFQLPDTPCEKLGKLLINGVSKCEVTNSDKTACSQKLAISNKTKLEFMN